MGSIDSLRAPQNKREFNCDWARRIMITHKENTDPGWLLAPQLKVLDVVARENSDPGMLSHSYFVQVSYKEESNGVLRIDSWFVKIPKAEATGAMDQVEVYMYNNLFPQMQKFVKSELKNKYGHELPVPTGLYSNYCSHFNQSKNIIVIEDLQSKRFKPLKGVCGVVYMRAQMRALAIVHASAFAYQEHLGGKRAFLRKNPLIKEKLLPKTKLIKQALTERLLPYLTFLSEVQPDLKHQLAIFIKFEKHIPKIFKNIHKTPGLHDFKIMTHGDSKLDNFLFKKVTYNSEDEYEAVLIDWQGVSYDFLSSDVMWALYGFMKNLPDKNATIESFLDYSIAYYHQEFLKELKLFKLNPAELYLPDNEYDGVSLIKKGFVYDFLRVVLIRPVLALQDPEALLSWFNNRGTQEVPSVYKVFKSGESYVNFIHLYFTIATEIGIFHELAPLCFSALKEAMFGDGKDEDSQSDEDEEQNKVYGLDKSTLPSATAAKLNLNHSNGIPNGEVAKELPRSPEPEPNGKSATNSSNGLVKESNSSADSNGVHGVEVSEQNPRSPGFEPSDDSTTNSSNGLVKESNSSADTNGAYSDEVSEQNPDLNRRPSYIRRQSTITLPDVLSDSEGEDCDEDHDCKTTVRTTIVLRTNSVEEKNF